MKKLTLIALVVSLTLLTMLVAVFATQAPAPTGTCGAANNGAVECTEPTEPFSPGDQAVQWTCNGATGTWDGQGCGKGVTSCDAKNPGECGQSCVPSFSQSCEDGSIGQSPTSPSDNGPVYSRTK